MPTTAIELLEKHKEQLMEECRRQIAQIDEDIAYLRRREADSIAETDQERIPVRVGQYRGMKAAAALQAWLNEREGGPCPLDQAASDLKFGGAEPKWTRDYKQNLKIVISNNKGIFRYDEKADTIELLNRSKKLA